MWTRPGSSQVIAATGLISTPNKRPRPLSSVACRRLPDGRGGLGAVERRGVQPPAGGGPGRPEERQGWLTGLTSGQGPRIGSLLGDPTSSILTTYVVVWQVPSVPADPAFLSCSCPPVDGPERTVSVLWSQSLVL